MMLMIYSHVTKAKGILIHWLKLGSRFHSLNALNVLKFVNVEM